MEVDEDLANYLKEKRKSDRFEDQVSILAVFEPILESVYKIYESKIFSRDDGQVEFPVESLAGGLDITDGVFYRDYFMQSAVYYMYESWLDIDVDKDTMFHDLFDLGAGSGTLDLFPEVNGICENCAADHFERFKSKASIEIQNVNKLVYKSQVSHSFTDPNRLGFVLGDFSDDSMEIPICNPFDEEDEVLSSSTTVKQDTGSIVNPFLDSDDSETDELYNCEICSSSFPSPDFVDLHRKVFHSEQVVPFTFVENAECLITSFVFPVIKSPSLSDASSSQEAEKVVQLDSEENKAEEKTDKETKKKTKYNFRKRLNL